MTDTPLDDRTPADAAPPADPATDVAPDAPSDGEAERLRGEMAGLQDQLLRRAAEFQNYRRRAESDRAAAEHRGREAALLPLLDVFDDLRRSLDAARRVTAQEAPTAAFDALAEGVELVYRKFEDALAGLGVHQIETSGQPFDVDLHEAVLQQPAPDGEASGTVLAEIQPGYTLGERVLRHARVIVAS